MLSIVELSASLGQSNFITGNFKFATFYNDDKRLILKPSDIEKIGNDVYLEKDRSELNTLRLF